MADFMVIRRGDSLVPCDKHGYEALSKYPFEKALKTSLKQPRNYKFHQKAFTLVDLAFQYWEPETMVSKIERDTCLKFSKYLAARGVDRDAVKLLLTDFINGLNSSRETLEADKNIEAFRNWVTIEAGFYNVVLTPSGPKREAKSWSFASMSEEAFEEMFSQILTVCWNLVLSKHFSSEQEAENAAAQLMSYA